MDKTSLKIIYEYIFSNQILSISIIYFAIGSSTQINYNLIELNWIFKNFSSIVVH